MFADEDLPQSTKLAAAHDERSAVADFLEWCSEQGYHLAHHVEGRNYPAILTETHDQVIMRYLDIDTAALEQERRAMLEAARDG